MDRKGPAMRAKQSELVQEKIARTYYLAAVVLSLLALTGIMVAYNSLPARVITHWGLAGEANGYGSRGVYLLLSALPIIFTTMMYWLPRLDPLLSNPKNAINRIKYSQVALLLAFFISAINLLTIAINLRLTDGLELPMGLLLSALFFFLGFVIQDARPSWFIGIRTPWALSSEKAWVKSNELAGKMFKAAGIAGFALALIIPVVALVAMMAIAIAAAVASAVVSYFEWKRDAVASK